MEKRKIIFACGGSGGHTYPLMAVAKEFLQDKDAWDCAFVSCYKSIEEKIVPREGHRLLLIPSGKLKGQNPLKALWSIGQVIASLVISIFYVIREKPSFVFSAGGYAGAPFLVAAALLGVPCGILEQNRIPGLANRWMARFCKIIFLNFSATQSAFKSANCVVVGHPYRLEIRAARWSEQDSAQRWEQNPFSLFVFGGSQGAQGVNRLVVEALPFLENQNIFIHHQTGPSDFENVKQNYAKNPHIKNLVEPYIYDMPAAYSRAHLVICRAGASSLAELAAAGKAALLIPLVSKDRHQEPNAFELSNCGAAACHLQPSLTGSKLADLIKGYYIDRQPLRDFAKKIIAFDHPSAAQDIAKKIKDLVYVKAQ